MQAAGQPAHLGASEKLRARIARGDGFVALRLDGIIDEHNGLAQWVDQVNQLAEGDRALLIDLGGVRRLNSLGVRDWVVWLRALRATWRTIVLFDCPPPVMNEVNFVKNFAEGAHIATFQAPLFCPRCQKEEARMLDAVSVRAGGGTLPSFRCERTDCENALDDDETTYLAFLAELPAPPDPTRLAALLAKARAALVTEARDIGRPEGPTLVALDARSQPSPARATALAQLGVASQSAAPASPPTLPNAPPTPGIPAAAAPVRSGDWLFIGAILTMLAILGVLVYLLMSVE